MEVNAQQFKAIANVESILPNGMGRSPIVNTMEEKDYKAYTSVQADKDKTRNKSERDEIRIRNYQESKLLNLYNIAGIRLRNIAVTTA
ncbi:hypothetical protein [uncultured Eudoraea sp.]|uniref:hypothetical protein n=1 Tax=uncultured Eudoraea sp. TaxID=1035614 RepID=UPI0026200634|nr:hypothetical protein [uncultured Eudoraea sp.]